MIGAALLLISICCIIWAHFNWEEYTTVTQNALTGRVKSKGLAPTLYGWGWGFAITIPIVYGMMWTTIDFNNPSFAVNKEGIFINKAFFKKMFLSWEEFSDIKRGDKNVLQLHLKDAEKIVNQQKGIGKLFLKQTYVCLLYTSPSPRDRG